MRPRIWDLLIGALVVMVTIGCQTTKLVKLTEPLEWPPLVVYAVGDPRAVVGEPVLLLAGDVAPADLYGITPEQWQAILAEYERISAAYTEALGQIENDRTRATLRVEAQIEALRVARQAQAQAFGMGTAVGFGACAGMERALGAITAPR